MKTPAWIRNVERMARGKPLVGQAHEKVESYAAPADFDRLRALADAQTKDGEIERLFWQHGGRVAHKWPHYLPIYDRLFAKFRAGFTPMDGTTRPPRFLEIGVSKGGSLQIWRKYFGPEATIFGIDIDPRCAAIDDANLAIRIGSQSDPSFLADVVAEMGGVDLILDDGSHVAEHQRASLDALFPLLSEGGLYVVEDCQTAYWRGWQGGHRRQGSFIEVAKSLIDDMHGWYHDRPIERPFAKDQVHSIAFYDGIVVIEKQPRPVPFHVMVGSPSLS